MNKTKYLYVLECIGNRYYIGIAYDVKKRFRQHIKGEKSGAVFTSIYHPIKCIELFELQIEDWDLAEVYENIKTIEYSKIYGNENVAGGNFCVRDNKVRSRQFYNIIKNNIIQVANIRYKLDDAKLLTNLLNFKKLELNEYDFDKINIENIVTIPAKKKINIENKVRIMLNRLNKKSINNIAIIIDVKQYIKEWKEELQITNNNEKSNE
jgi:hypothetical protein